MSRAPALKAFLLFAFCALCQPATAKPSLMRFPSAGPGSIAFVARGDVWLVSRDGGRARRIVEAKGTISNLHFSPDGRWIAFTQRIAGGQDVFAASAKGGDVRRLTHDARAAAAANLVLGWTPDGANVVFLSNRTSVASSQMQAFEVPIVGGAARRLPLPQTGLLAFSPDGSQVAHTKTFTGLATRKRYLGGQAEELYLHDLRSRSERRLTSWRGTDTAPMWIGRRLYFLSDRGRAMRLNIWCLDLDRGTTRQVTHFTDFDVDWPSLSSGLITFQQAGSLWTLDATTERLIRLQVELPGSSERAVRHTASVGGEVRSADATGATAFSTTRDGGSILVASHGDIFRVSAEGAATNLTSTPATDEETPVSSPDGQLIAYVSEDANAQQLAVRPITGGRERIFTRFNDTILYRPTFSCDGRMLLVADAQHRLWLVSTITGGAPVLIARDPVAEIRDATFSPDGRYVAYSTTRPTGLSALHLYEVQGGHDRILSDELNGDRMPAFSPDGRRLLFVSRRHELPLRPDRGDEASLFTVSSDGIYSIPLPETKAAEPDGARADSMRDIVRLPVSPARIVALETRGTSVLYQTRPPELIDGELPGSVARLHRLERGKDEVILEDFDQAVPSADGTRVAFVRNGSWFIRDVATKTERVVPLAGMRLVVDPAAEWREMFERTWRLDRDAFFSKVMNGTDWNSVHKAYARYLPLLGSRDDALYLIGQLQGEMATSHAYVAGLDPPSTKSLPTPRIGADLRVDPVDGRYRFAKVFRGDPSRERFRAPLHEPREGPASVDVAEGETLLAVDGVDLRAPTDPDALLAGHSGPIRLTIGSQDGRKAREVTVSPLKDDLDLRQHAWVESNRAKVAALSGGHIGYLFVTDFNGDGTQDLFRQLQGQLDKDGIVIDVRWNRGGYTSQAVLDLLRRVRAGSFVNREGALAPLPLYVAPRAMTVLTNADSASDGDQFPFFFREFGLGKVVGQRTWGGVQGISGSIRLMDGIRLAIPKDSLASVDGRWLIENVGTEPDIAVDPAPDEAVTGRDRMLESAVREVKRVLAENPPPVATKPPALPAYPPAGAPLGFPTNQ